MTLAELNRLDRAQFVKALGGIYEHSPWVAEQAWLRRPFATIDELHAAMKDSVASAGHPQQLALIRAHPDLAGKAMLRRELTVNSTLEQRGAGLDQCSAEELARLNALNAQYKEKFAFPFVLAVKGLDRATIIAAFERRVGNDAHVEFVECLQQIDKIAGSRLAARFSEDPDQ